MTGQINLLQAKYPSKALAAIDARYAFCDQTSCTSDLYHAAPTIHARKPRSRDLVELTLFDEEVEFFVCEETDTVYYMPRRKQQYRIYNTDIVLTGTVTEDVTSIVEAALKQSLNELGEMKHGESRIFWIDNEQMVNAYPMIHATVVKEKREYRVVTEIGRSDLGCYTKLLSLSLPADAL